MTTEINPKEELNKKIRVFSEKFQFIIMSRSNIIDQELTMIICVELMKKWSDMVDFIDYFQEVAFSRKIDLVQTILKCNHREIYDKYPNLFIQLYQIKDYRDKLAHFTFSYLLGDGESEAWYVLSPMIVREAENKEEKLSVNKMQGLMDMAEKCSVMVQEIKKLVANEKGIRL